MIILFNFLLQIFDNLSKEQIGKMMKKATGVREYNMTNTITGKYLKRLICLIETCLI